MKKKRSSIIKRSIEYLKILKKKNTLIEAIKLEMKQLNVIQNEKNQRKKKFL